MFHWLTGVEIRVPDSKHHPHADLEEQRISYTEPLFKIPLSYAQRLACNFWAHYQTRASSGIIAKFWSQTSGTHARPRPLNTMLTQAHQM